MKKLLLNRYTLFIIFISAVIHALITFPSGSNWCFNLQCGISFWGAHGHDGIWHLAVSNVSFNTLPFVSPIFFGEGLNGYNYLLDLVIHIFSYFSIPAEFSYFKLLPVVWFLSLMSVLLVFVKQNRLGQTYLRWLLFFIFLGGSFSYLTTLKEGNFIWGSAGVQAMQSALMLVNIQFALSLPLLVMIMLLLPKSDTRKNYVILAFLVALMFGLKFYGGVISFVLVVSHYLIEVIKSRNVRLFVIQSLTLTIFISFSIIFFYNPIQSSKTGSVLSLSPFSIVHSIIEEPSQFYMPKVVNARYSLLSSGKFSLKLLLIELSTALMFIIVNFGTRLVGLWYIAYSMIKKKLSALEVSMLLAIGASIMLPILFVQKGEWWNTIQFIYYGFFLSSFFAAKSLSLINKNSITIAVVVLILTIPNTIDVIKTFTSGPASYISNTEREALKFLSKQTAGVVWTVPYEASVKNGFKAPYPLYAYDDTAYVAAFGKKQVYFADTHVLRITGVDYLKREEEVRSQSILKLIEKDITYLYIANPYKKKYATMIQSANTRLTNIKIVRIFSNREADIYRLTGVNDL